MEENPYKAPREKGYGVGRSRRMWLVFSFLLSASVMLTAGCSRHPIGPQAAVDDETVVIFRDPDGRTLTMADLRGVSGSFQYEILRKANVPAEAEQLHEQARRAGGSGDYNKAIDLLERAASLAPEWPYPVYDLAYTYLLTNDVGKARKYYGKTLDLAPRGFFTAITALDALDREANGDLPEGTYLAYLSLEWQEPAANTGVVRRLVEHVPNFAPAWKEMAMQAESDKEKMAAIEKGLEAHPDGETNGILLINKALVQDRCGDHDGAVQLLAKLALDPSSTYATEHLAKVTLASIVDK